MHREWITRLADRVRHEFAGSYFLPAAHRPDVQRLAIGTFVASLHLFLFLLLLRAVAPVATTVDAELEVTVGGFTSAKVQPQRLPPPPVPDLPVVAPPPIVIADVPVAEASPSGSQNVTAPAQAIAASHEFPGLPAAARPDSAVRLLLFISELGVITDAQVRDSSGSPSLDDLAVVWVKAHWRYRPATRNGLPVSVTTTAIVLFKRAGG